MPNAGEVMTVVAEAAVRLGVGVTGGR